MLKPAGGSARVPPTGAYEKSRSAWSWRKRAMSAAAGLRRDSIDFTLDVFEHARVDPVNQVVGVELPVPFGRHLELVPCAALEARAAVRQRDEAELAASRAEVAVKVRRRDVAVRRPLGHRRRGTRDVERQPPARFPRGDRLDERAGREDAVAHGADARSLDARVLRR